MVRLFFIVITLTMVTPLYGQNKGRKDTRIPTINEQFKRFSIFAFKDDQYVHQETNDVWMDTFIEIKPKAQMVHLPGLGNRQTCKYEISDCEFIENEGGIQLIKIPINCTTLDGKDEKRILRIHHIMANRSSNYIFSLGYLDTKDLVMFHNYSDSELGQLLSKDLIRFE